MSHDKHFSQGASSVYYDHELQEYVMNISSRGGQYVDVYLQDQTSPTFAYYFKKQIGSATLALNTNINDYTLTLSSGHGFQTGEYVSILEDGRAMQCYVINVATNVITLDQPLEYAYTTKAEVRRTSTAMNVDGSSTPQIFNIKPCPCMKWHINQIILNITDGVEMDSGKFGGISALTKGIVLRKKDGTYYNLLNAKTNNELDVKGFTVKYDSKAPSGIYGLTSTKLFNSQSGAGCAILIDGSTNDELEIIIQDNLTELSSFTAVAIGHYVMS